MKKTQVVEMFVAAQNQGLVAQFKKFGTVQARPAVAGEVVETIINGITETTNTAGDNDIVVTNPGGEHYIVGDEKFTSRYELVSGNTYLAKGECFGFVYNGESFSFDAPWGEVEDGDQIVVSSLEDTNDIYRIERQAFVDTYKAA